MKKIKFKIADEKKKEVTIKNYELRYLLTLGFFLSVILIQFEKNTLK